MSASRPGITGPQRLVVAIDDLITELAALPEESFTRQPAPEEWTAAEVAAHMSEMMPYWARMAAEVAAEPGRTLGREEGDPDRIGPVQAVNGLPRDAALARLRSAAHEAAESVRAHDETAWQREGMHPTRGPMAVGALITPLIVEHTEGHVRQALAAALPTEP